MKIALGGKMGSGKDTFYDYIKDKYNFKQVSFAEPLYQIMYYAQDICGFQKVKDRKFLQFLGTEWGRSINNNCWIDIVHNKTKNSTTINWCLTDLRFENEFNYLKNNNWILIKIQRDNIDKLRKGTGTTTHLSEIGLDNISNDEWNFIINNNSSLEEYYFNIENIMSNIISSS